MIMGIQTLIRLVLAAVLGGAIGFERETHGRAAGFRTHILVCVGSCLIMLTSIYLFNAYKGEVPLDPGRIAAQVVSGIGFLGAGTIIRFRASVRGLTTAASLWSVAGIGLAIGTGFYWAALAATAIIFISLFALTKIEAKMIRKDFYATLIVETKPDVASLQKIRDILSDYRAGIRDFQIKRLENQNIVYNFDLRVLTTKQNEIIIEDIARIKEVESARWG